MWYLQYVYSITCPVTGLVMYIGKTNNPHFRFGCHRRGDGYCLIGKWCKAMHSIGLPPIYKVIDFTYGDVHAMEMDYIHHYKYLGQCFFNVGKNDSYIKYAEIRNYIS